MKYIDYLKDSFLIEEAERYDIKGRKYIGSLSKYYFCDIGVRNAILNFRQQEENHIMENLLYNELRTRGYNVDVGIVETKKNVGGKTMRQQYEVDFVVNDGSSRYYIQSAFAMPDIEKERQEKTSFELINDSFKKKEAVYLTTTSLLHFSILLIVFAVVVIGDYVTHVINGRNERS